MNSAGYLIRKDDDILFIADHGHRADTYEYCLKEGRYGRTLSQGGFKRASGEICQWAMHCYSLFVFPTSQNSLSSYFVIIKEKFNFTRRTIPTRCIRS